MGGDTTVQPAARARTTPASKPQVPPKAKTTVTSPRVTTTFTSPRVTTTFTSTKITTRFTSGVPTDPRLVKAQAFLADPARPRDEKIDLFKRLMRGDVDAQRIALTHLAKPAWIYYLKRHDNTLVRLVEKLTTKQLGSEQSRHVTPREKTMWAENHRRAQLIWKTIAEDVGYLRKKAFISARCDFSERTLNKLNKRGIERLFKAVKGKSFRTPRECRL